MSAIDDARYICQEIGSVRDAITDMTTMLVSALTNQDLAAQLKALEERFKVLSDCYESHLVALHPAKQSIRFGPVLNDAKPAPAPSEEAVDELIQQADMLLEFIPDGWSMPLGFSVVANQYKQARARVLRGE